MDTCNAACCIIAAMSEGSNCMEMKFVEILRIAIDGANSRFPRDQMAA